MNRLLGDISSTIDYGVTASAVESPVGPKFLRITDIQDGAVNWDTVPWCSCTAREAQACQLQDGDIVFARTGATTGKSFLIRQAPSGSVFASYLIRVRLGKDANPAYVSHFFNSPGYWRQITGRARGVAQPGVNSTSLKTLEIPLPPLAEQKRIAGILDAADALRGKRREAIGQLDTLLQATFLDMFGDPVSNPKGWKRATFGSLILNGPQNGIYKPAKDYGSGTRILRIDGFYDGAVTDLASLKRVRVSDKEIDLYSLAESDIVINRVNSHSHLGKCALVPSLGEPVVFESNMMRLALDARRMVPRFATQFLQTRYVKNQILSACKDAVNQSSINQTDVKGFQILVPPLKVQQRFGAVVALIDEQKTAHRAHLAELDALFASLQSRAFRGEL